MNKLIEADYKKFLDLLPEYKERMQDYIMALAEFHCNQNNITDKKEINKINNSLHNEFEKFIKETTEYVKKHDLINAKETYRDFTTELNYIKSHSIENYKMQLKYYNMFWNELSDLSMKEIETKIKNYDPESKSFISANLQKKFTKNFDMIKMPDRFNLYKFTLSFIKLGADIKSIKTPEGSGLFSKSLDVLIQNETQNYVAKNPNKKVVIDSITPKVIEEAPKTKEVASEPKTSIHSMLPVMTAPEKKSLGFDIDLYKNEAITGKQNISFYSDLNSCIKFSAQGNDSPDIMIDLNRKILVLKDTNKKDSLQVIPISSVELTSNDNLVFHVNNGTDDTKFKITANQILRIDSKNTTVMETYDKPLDIALPNTFFSDVKNQLLICKTFPYQMFEAFKQHHMGVETMEVENTNIKLLKCEAGLFIAQGRELKPVTHISAFDNLNTKNKGIKTSTYIQFSKTKSFERGKPTNASGAFIKNNQLEEILSFCKNSSLPANKIDPIGGETEFEEQRINASRINKQNNMTKDIDLVFAKRSESDNEDREFDPDFENRIIPPPNSNNNNNNQGSGNSGKNGTDGKDGRNATDGKDEKSGTDVNNGIDVKDGKSGTDKNKDKSDKKNEQTNKENGLIPEKNKEENKPKNEGKAEDNSDKEKITVKLPFNFFLILAVFCGLLAFLTGGSALLIVMALGLGFAGLSTKPLEYERTVSTNPKELGKARKHSTKYERRMELNKEKAYRKDQQFQEDMERQYQLDKEKSERKNKQKNLTNAEKNKQADEVRKKGYEFKNSLFAHLTSPIRRRMENRANKKEDNLLKKQNELRQKELDLKKEQKAILDTEIKLTDASTKQAIKALEKAKKLEEKMKKYDSGIKEAEEKREEAKNQKAMAESDKNKSENPSILTEGESLTDEAKAKIAETMEEKRKSELENKPFSFNDPDYKKLKDFDLLGSESNGNKDKQLPKDDDEKTP